MLETEEYIPIPTYSQEVHLRYYLDFKAGRLFLEEVLITNTAWEAVTAALTIIKYVRCILHRKN